MMTVKIIHYPEGDGKTTEVYETTNVKLVETYLSEIENDLGRFDYSYGYRNATFIDKSWVAILTTDRGIGLLYPNAEVYIMSDGKTVMSHKSEIIA
jgi:hypothetical protein